VYKYVEGVGHVQVGKRDSDSLKMDPSTRDAYIKWGKENFGDDWTPVFDDGAVFTKHTVMTAEFAKSSSARPEIVTPERLMRSVFTDVLRAEGDRKNLEDNSQSNALPPVQIHLTVEVAKNGVFMGDDMSLKNLVRKINDMLLHEWERKGLKPQFTPVT